MTITKPRRWTAPAPGGSSRYVTVPGLRNIFVFIITTTVLASANMFGQSYLVTNGGPGDSTRTAFMVMTEEGLRGSRWARRRRCATCSPLPGHISVVNFLAIERGSGSDHDDDHDEPAAPPSSPPVRRRRAYRQDRNGPFFWVGIVVLALIFVIPLLWMFLTSFRTEEDSRPIPSR